jgi:hypothetical protein
VPLARPSPPIYPIPPTAPTTKRRIRDAKFFSSSCSRSTTHPFHSWSWLHPSRPPKEKARRNGRWRSRRPRAVDLGCAGCGGWVGEEASDGGGCAASSIRCSSSSVGAAAGGLAEEHYRRARPGARSRRPSDASRSRCAPQLPNFHCLFHRKNK